MDKAAIEALIEKYDGAEAVCIAVVAFGLIGEAMNLQTCPLVNVFCKWAIVVGVSGEFITHIWQMRASKNLLALQNEESDQLNLKIAEANKAAEEARLELEKYKAPRSLSEQQKDDIRNGLSQIAISPREIDALICGETAEISNISEVIISLLEQSGWDVRVCRPLGEFVTGILIDVRAGSDASTNSAADVIVGLLSNCELTVEKTEFHDGEGGISLVSSSTSGQTTEAAMRIIIGAKW